MAHKLPIDRLRVVLVAPRNPLNLGAAARAMANFGFSDLRVVNPYEVAFRDARSAVGAAKVLTDAREFGSVAEAVADSALVVGTTAVRHRALHHSLQRVEYGARQIRKQLASAPVALVFGSERYGLSNDDLSHCHWLLRVPAYGDQISMNLGQAVAICLYELIRDGRTPSDARKEKLAASKKIELMTGSLLEALQISGYVKPGAEVLTEQKLRRLIRRQNMSARDAELGLGILRQILWKLSQGE
jgi:tRNA/rRNA methyltransferase